MVSMNKLTDAKRAEVIRCIVEGNSIRSTVRITGVAKNTITKLLLEVGNLCASYEDRTLRNIKSKRVQCDEIWSFVYAKQKNVTAEISAKHQAGDMWTWTAIDADTRLTISWMLGGRDAVIAKHFMEDLASRLANRVQLTTDGHRVYLNAVEDVFGSEIDYALLVKVFESTQDETRYRPAKCVDCHSQIVTGNPDMAHVSTSYVERQNLSMRMQMRRFTRLTNAFSKRAANHAAALALYFVYYNWVRVHQTLLVTPAMEAGLTDHLWTIEEMLKNISN